MSHTPVPTPRVMSREKLAATMGWVSASASTESATAAMTAAHPNMDVSGSRSAFRPAGTGSRMTARIVRSAKSGDGEGPSTLRNSSRSRSSLTIVEWVVALHPRFSRCSASSFRAR